MVAQLTEGQKRALKGVADKGMVTATKSLSKMVESRVEVEMSKVQFLPIGEVPKRVGGPDTLAMGIYLRMMGDLGGTSLLVLSRESSLALSDLLYGRDIGTTEILSYDDRSALGEVGNILTASYLTELGNFLGVTLYHSPPCIVFDVAKSLIDFVLRGIDKRIESVLIIQVKFRGKRGEITGDFIFLLDSSSLGVLVNKIDRKLKSL
ncbi:MAG: chemotaxis protein CheC [Candidatus Altiarchaeota archaeon]|nr:chemotaxis protein CheC [Candidatus Altiarchaeota archaeon]